MQSDTNLDPNPTYPTSSASFTTQAARLRLSSGNGMAHQRVISTTAAGSSHPISLKVLRLSKPSLATQTPLPQTSFGNGLDISPKASLAYPSADQDSSFPLTPLLTLPSAFGAAYVGETFTCTLCANNEVKEGDNRTVSGVRISAELQTPSDPKGIVLELAKAESEGEGLDIEPGATLQRTLKHELKEEGQHVLAVTVNYTETLLGSGGGASGGRARTFRKLYQFVAQQLIAVRSKVTERKRRSKDEQRQWILEAQVENVGDTSVVLEKLWLNESDGVSSTALKGSSDRELMSLKPQDIEQLMFLVKEDEVSQDAAARVPLAQLNIDWRSAMGERGSLTTGWLTSKGR